jgi:hypothetical protein
MSFNTNTVDQTAAVRQFQAQRRQERAEASAAVEQARAEARAQAAAEQAARQNTLEARALSERREAYEWDAREAQERMYQARGDVAERAQGLRAALRAKAGQAIIDALQADANGNR